MKVLSTKSTKSTKRAKTYYFLLLNVRAFRVVCGQ